MAQKIDLTSVYTSEEKYTVLQLLKKFIDVIEKFDVGQPLYRHKLPLFQGYIEFIDTSKQPHVLSYDEHEEWLIDGMRAEMFLSTRLGICYHLYNTLQYFTVSHIANGNELSCSYYDDGDLVTEPLTDGIENVYTSEVSTTLF